MTAALRKQYQRDLRRESVDPPAMYNMRKHMLHFCHCGEWGSFGFGLPARADQIWRCAKCAKEEGLTTDRAPKLAKDGLRRDGCGLRRT